jgi:hypothetical protein
MQEEPLTPFSNMSWIKWIDRTELPPIVIGIIAFIFFLPFYDFNALPPSMPGQGGVFPPAFAICLLFLLYLARGANNDLGLLVRSNKIKVESLQSLSASRRMALLELAIGLYIGFERIYSQIYYAYGDLDQLLAAGDIYTAAFWAVNVSIVLYTILQVHLLLFCIRQIRTFNRIARELPVDLLAPDLNNIISNPLIRFALVGLLAISFGLLVYELVPYSSMQKRFMVTGLIGVLIWLVLMSFSLIPLFTLKSRVAVAKAQELNCIRRAIQGEPDSMEQSRLGSRIHEFALPDLLYYEDRIKNIWEWPFEAHIRRFIIFGFIPPLTWILAAIVESLFETLVF